MADAGAATGGAATGGEGATREELRARLRSRIDESKKRRTLARRSGEREASDTERNRQILHVLRGACGKAGIALNPEMERGFMAVQRSIFSSDEPSFVAALRKLLLAYGLSKEDAEVAAEAMGPELRECRLGDDAVKLQQLWGKLMDQLLMLQELRGGAR